MYLMVYPHDELWYPFIDMDDCPRFSTCYNCSRNICPVVENAKRRYINESIT